MPLFYFDIYDKDGCHRDQVGDEFDDVSQARDQVHALLPDLARGQFLDGVEETIACCVRDAGGETLYRGELLFRGTMLKDEACEVGDGASMPH